MGMTPDEQLMARAAEAGGDLPIAPLGSGSDYTPFLQHLGISALNVGYAGEDVEASIYHSTYDSFDHYIRFGDPNFVYCAALAQTAGRIVLRASEADVLPMRFADLADSVARYAAEVERLADQERRNATAVNNLINEGVFKLAADPQQAYVPPASPSDVPILVFAPLNSAVTRLKRSAQAYDDALDRVAAQDFNLPAADLARLNGILQSIEQQLANERGLPGRPWYQHMLYAPGSYTGYAAKTLPGVREAIELRRWPDAIDYITVVAETLAKAAARIDDATATLTYHDRPAEPAKPPSRGAVLPPPSDS
jgi:N-acetylated-alpha-linked acidic dipeptidase